MTQVQGKVKRIYTKAVAGGKHTFSFQVYDDTNYYRLNFTKPTEVGISENVNVEFNYTQGQYGFDVDPKSIVVTGRSAAPAASAPSAAPKAKVGSKDDYWTQKDEYDKKIKEPLIHFQSAYNIATTIVAAALEKEVLPLPAKAGAKFDAYMEMVHQVQADIYDRIQRHKAFLESGEQPQPAASAVLGAVASESDDDWNAQ